MELLRRFEAACSREIDEEFGRMFEDMGAPYSPGRARSTPKGKPGPRSSGPSTLARDPLFIHLTEFGEEIMRQYLKSRRKKSGR